MCSTKIVPIVILSVLVSGCASIKPVTPTTTNYDFPPLEQITERELGDTLIDKGIVRSYPAIETTEAAVGSCGFGIKLRAHAGTYVASGMTDYGIFYRSPTPIYRESVLASGFYEGGIFVSFNSSFGPCVYAIVGAETVKSYQLQNFSYRTTVSDQPQPGSFRQELIYNGKSGENLKFLYRELKDSYLRAPFTQEISYDLKEGDVIGFKGARLKVIEATNTKIKYQVTKRFD